MTLIGATRGETWDTGGTTKFAPSQRELTQGDDHSLRTSDRMAIVSPPASVRHPDATSVYLYYDTDGLLIYVGITSRGIARNREHDTSKAWWPHVAHQEVAHYASRAEASEHEKLLIRRYRPPFNRQHNPEWSELQEAYTAYRSATVTASSPRELFDALSRHMPLVLWDHPEDRRVVMRSQAAHSPLALAVVDQPRVPVAGGMRPGRVSRIEHRGMLTLFHLNVESRTSVTSGTAVLKCVNQKAQTFALRSVRLNAAPVQ